MVQISRLNWWDYLIKLSEDTNYVDWEDQPGDPDPHWDPVRGVPGSRLPLKFDPFLPAPWIFFIDGPKNNFSCSLNLFWYLPAPSTFVNLLPELKSGPKRTVGVFLC